MPSDEEFRRVAEDLRGLARSLTRDLRDAADRIREQSRSGWSAPNSHWNHRWGNHWGDTVPPPPSGQSNVTGEPEPPPDGTGQPTGGGSWDRGTPWMPTPGWNPEDWRRAGYAWRGRRGHRGPPRHWGAGPYGPATEGNGAAPTAGTMTMPPPPPAPRPRRQRPPLRHRRDGSTLVAALALVFGVAWLASRTHLVSVSTEVVLAIALMILGGTMVLTARTDWALSRRAWPALLGAGLVIAAVATSPSLGVPTDWNDLRIGTHSVSYSTWESLPAVYHGGIGKTTVDLSALPARPPQDRRLDVTTTTGQLVILLPTDVRVVVDAELAVGAIDVNGRVVDDGIRPSVHQVVGADIPGGVLTIHAKSGPGNIRIEVGSAPHPETPITPIPPITPVGPGGTR